MGVTCGWEPEPSQLLCPHRAPRQTLQSHPWAHKFKQLQTKIKDRTMTPTLPWKGFLSRSTPLVSGTRQKALHTCSLILRITLQHKLLFFLHSDTFLVHIKAYSRKPSPMSPSLFQIPCPPSHCHQLLVCLSTVSVYRQGNSDTDSSTLLFLRTEEGVCPVCTSVSSSSNPLYVCLD